MTGGTRIYAYVSFMNNPRNVDGKGPLTLEEQKAKMLQYGKTFGGYSYIFSETDANTNEPSTNSSRIAFDILFRLLNEGDRLYIYSWQCLIDGNNFKNLSKTVFDRLQQIADKGVIVHFINEKLTLSNPKDKFCLVNLINAMQYDYDLLQDTPRCEVVCSSSNSCASANSNNCKPGC